MNEDDRQEGRDPAGAPTEARGIGPRGMEGVTLDGRYLIERELGRGGIGAVYLARDQKLLGKPVVVKILLEQLGDDETAAWGRREIHQEIEAPARPDPPRGVGALHAGELPDAR